MYNLILTGLINKNSHKELPPRIWQFCTQYIIQFQKIFFFFFSLNVVIKCNCYLYIITCGRMEYKIVCKYVERTFVSWNNLCPIQMLYS